MPDGLQRDEILFQKIIGILEEADALSSWNWLGKKHYSDWQIRLQLSPERANLLRPFCFQGMDVLELGADSSTVSRFLAENAETLKIVAKNENHFMALNKRLSDVTNWDAVVAHPGHYFDGNRYSVVTSIGDWRVPVSLQSDFDRDPLLGFLANVRRNLNDNGVFILALGNQLGLKYLSGATEDRSMKLFEGICGYSLREAQGTYSRAELHAKLERSGFQDIRFFYPFPDYKLAKSILSEDLASLAPRLACDMAATEAFESYGQLRVKYLPERLALRTIASAGLFSELANSFLVFASPTRGSSITANVLGSFAKNQLASHLSIRKKFAVSTTFSAITPGQLDIKKRILWGDPPEDSVDSLSWRELNETHIEGGEYVGFLLSSHSFYNLADQFIEELVEFLKFVVSKSADGQNLTGDLVDATFWNAKKIGDRSYFLFDQEFIRSEPFPISWFIFRNVSGLKKFICSRSELFKFPTYEDFYNFICERLAVSSDFLRDLNLEAQFLFTLSQSSGTFDETKERLLKQFQSAAQWVGFPLLQALQSNCHRELDTFSDWMANESNRKIKNELQEKLNIIEKLEQQAERLASKVKTLEARVSIDENLQKKLQEKDNYVEVLEGRVERSASKVKTLEARVSIDENLQKKLQEKDNYIGILEGRVEKSAAKVKTLEARAAGEEDTLKKLQAKDTQIQSLKLEIDQIKQILKSDRSSKSSL